MKVKSLDQWKPRPWTLPSEGVRFSAQWRRRERLPSDVLFADGQACLVEPQFSLNISRATTRGQIWLHGEGTKLGMLNDLWVIKGGFDQKVLHDCTKLKNHKKAIIKEVTEEDGCCLPPPQAHTHM